MLVGVFLATIIDATILYKTFDSEMFPAEGAWPPGVASAESILAVVEKGKKALLLIVGVVIGVGGKMNRYSYRPSRRIMVRRFRSYDSSWRRINCNRYH